jgi:hypothetical protein
MKNSTNADNELSLKRVFKKIGGHIQELTKPVYSRVKMYRMHMPARSNAVASPQALVKPEVAKAIVKPATPKLDIKPVTIQSEAAKKIKFEKDMAGIRKIVSDAKQRWAYEAKQEEEAKPDYYNGKLYYIINGSYYVMWYKGRLWTFNMSNPNWFLLTALKASFQILGDKGAPKDPLAGAFYPTTKDDLKDILNYKYDLQGLYLKYHLERLSEWNFTNPDNLKDFLKMSDMVDYNKAIKV